MLESCLLKIWAHEFGNIMRKRAPPPPLMTHSANYRSYRDKFLSLPKKFDT